MAKRSPQATADVIASGLIAALAGWTKASAGETEVVVRRADRCRRVIVDVPGRRIRVQVRAGAPGWRDVIPWHTSADYTGRGGITRLVADAATLANSDR